MAKEKIPEKLKSRIVYKLQSGERVPGVTTITGQFGWNKEVLIRWSNRLGLQGIDSAKYKDEKAEVGKLAHKIITDWLLNIKTDFSDYSKNQIDQAENSALSFFEWIKHKQIKAMLIERPLVSEKYKFGGTADIYGQINGDFELIDLKTGSGIYDEMIIQVSAYRELLIENGHKVNKIRILNIPRSEDEAFKEQLIENHETAWQIFLNCLNIYKLKKKL